MSELPLNSPPLEPLVPMQSGTLDFFSLLILVGILLYTGYHVVHFLAHYIDAANRPRFATPRPSSYARAFAVEWWFGLGMALSYPLGYLPLQRWRPDPEKGPPILLMHGYLMNRSCFFALFWRLRRLGYRNVQTLNLRPMYGAIEDMAEDVAEEIRRLSERCDGRPVVVVAHSMAGIVVRWLLQRDAAVPVTKVITVATPHHGTRLAVLAPGLNARQLRLGSDFLGRLEPACRVPLVSIYATTDSVIIPSDSAAAGDTVIRFEGAGHLSLLYEARVFEAIVHHIPPLGPMPLGTGVSPSERETQRVPAL